MENLYRVSLLVSALLKLEETEGKIIVETNVPGKYASCRHPLSFHSHPRAFYRHRLSDRLLNKIVVFSSLGKSFKFSLVYFI